MARDSLLPFALPDIGEEEEREVLEALRSGWITTGPKTKAFEQQFAERVGAKHAIAVNSCTAALHLSLEAIGVSEGDEVITSPYTFAASAEVIRHSGARPVFVDVDPITFNIDPALVAKAVTPRTRAIIAIDIAGLPADLDAIGAIAREHGVRVVEDAAHAFPTRYHGRMVGSISDFTCFSFYATKTIATGEGGMITTDDDDAANRCRVLSLHGIGRDAWKRQNADRPWFYEIVAPGYKYNLTDIASALGLAQLRRADAMWRRRREIAERYNDALRDVAALQIPADSPDAQHAWHLYMLRVQPAQLTIGRAEFIQELRRRNIATSVHFIPLHLHPYYRETYGYAPDDFPIAVAQYEREISLPIHTRMSDADVEDVIEAVTAIVHAHRRDATGAAASARA